MIPNISIEDYEKLTPLCRVQLPTAELKFYCPSSMALWRAKTLLTKEPSTIAWLNDMMPSERLLDVGANVGSYTVYAAKIKGLAVDAIEPECQNFSILSRNVRLNNISDRVKIWPIGVSDVTKLDVLYISDDRPGGSCHSVGEEVSFSLKPKKFPYSQGIYVTTIDDLVANGAIETPNHIKLDIDGFEHKVIDGAKKTLEGNSVRSLSIEINPSIEEHNKIVSRLLELGFKYSNEQVQAATRKDGIFVGVGEYIFKR